KGIPVNITSDTPNARGRAGNQSPIEDGREPPVPSLILSALQKLSAAIGAEDPPAFAGELARELPDLADKRLRVFAAGVIGEISELHVARPPDLRVTAPELAGEIRRRTIEAMEAAMGPSAREPGPLR